MFNLTLTSDVSEIFARFDEREEAGVFEVVAGNGRPEV